MSNNFEVKGQDHRAFYTNFSLTISLSVTHSDKICYHELLWWWCCWFGRWGVQQLQQARGELWWERAYLHQGYWGICGLGKNDRLSMVRIYRNMDFFLGYSILYYHHFTVFHKNILQEFALNKYFFKRANSAICQIS